MITRPRAQNQRPERRSRPGSILILSAVMMVVMVIFCAFAIDVGYMCMVKAEAQACADSAALAAAWDMVNEQRLTGDHDAVFNYARASGVRFAALNQVAKQSPNLDPNYADSVDGDIVIGRLENPSNRNENLSFADPSQYNAVQVRLRCTASRGQDSPLFFARIIGHERFDTEATATAAFADNIVGFRVTDRTGNCSLIPFTVLLSDWQNCLGGGGTDDWRFDAETGNLLPGGDGITEMVMFPGSESGNGNGHDSITPGNWGTADIGNTNNSTADLRRQISEGINASDMAAMGGEVRLDPNTGTLSLNGDTGISAGMSSALADVLGDARTIPLYQAVAGQGNNTWYEIVGFAGIRILDYRLTGNNKYIQIQPAIVCDPTAITGDGANHSYFVGKPVHLVR